jgi:hypothetical protein
MITAIILTAIATLTIQYLIKRVKIKNPLITLIDKRIENKLKEIIKE